MVGEVGLGLEEGKVIFNSPVESCDGVGKGGDKWNEMTVGVGVRWGMVRVRVRRWRLISRWVVQTLDGSHGVGIRVRIRWGVVGVRARWGRGVGGGLVQVVSTFQGVRVREEGGGMQSLVWVGKIRVGVWVRKRMQTLVRVGGEGVGSGEGC